MLFFIDIAGDEVKINNVPTLLNKVSSRVQQLIKEGRIKDNMFEDIVDENGDCVGEWEYMKVVDGEKNANDQTASNIPDDEIDEWVKEIAYDINSYGHDLNDARFEEFVTDIMIETIIQRKKYHR